MKQILHHKTVLVVGTGISGIGAVQLLIQAEAYPVLFDANAALDIDTVRNKLQGIQNIPIYVGKLPKDMEEKIELLVISPGVARDNEFVKSFAERGIAVWGEVELAFAFEKGDVLAITGTNGKTTTTALTGAIVQAANKNSFVVGNIGNPYTSAVLQSNQDSVTVAEISSFQLETIEHFRPRVSAILNITPDHLDRHHSLDNYILEKEKIASNQTKEDTIVLNYEDSITREIGKRVQAKIVYFSSKTKLENGFYLEDDVIYKATNGKASPLIHVQETQLLGTHSYENIMAAIAITDAYGIQMEDILTAVRSFKAVEHRIEFVMNVNGVDYYNDSKGTNVDAAIKGIQAMVKPTYLIGGGYNKGASYDEWIDAFDGKVKELILLGATRDLIAACAKSHGFQNIKYVESLQEAIEYCASKAQNGDAVLLSPACASWGMFKNYEERGNMFKEMVQNLRSE